MESEKDEEENDESGREEDENEYSGKEVEVKTVKTVEIVFEKEGTNDEEMDEDEDDPEMPALVYELLKDK